MKEKRTFPQIGARIIKSAVGVALCMQPYSETTLTMAKQRSIGTFIGAGFGLVFLLVERLFENPSVAAVYLCASAMIIPIIYLTVLLDKRNASFFSCVVFLSITITHGFDADPFLFVWNRVLDTFIGIGVLLNIPIFERKHDNSVLYVSGIDDVLVGSSNAMIPYNMVELNRLIAKGAMFTVSTVESPATLLSLMSGVELKLPVIAMDGAVLYDTVENAYIERIPLDGQTAKKCEALITANGLHCFVNALCENTLMIYYGDFANEKEDLFNNMRKSPYRNYVRKEFRFEGAEVIYLLVLAENEQVERLREKLLSELSDSIRITVTPAREYDGYSRMRVYSPESGKAVMLERLMERTGASKCVTFGSIEGQCGKLLDGILNLMKTMGMWSGEVAPVREPMTSIGRNVGFVNSDAAGVFTPLVSTEEYVEEGALLARITDPLDGEPVSEIRSDKAALCTLSTADR